MNNYFEKIHIWFGTKSPRERVFFFILGLVLIYMFFSIFLLKPLLNEKKDLKDKTNTLLNEIAAQNQQLSMITTAVNNGTLLTSLNQLNKIKTKIVETQNTLKQLKPMVTTPAEAAGISKAILNLELPHVTLYSIKDFPPVPWEIDAKNKSDIGNIDTSNIMQHDFQLEFESDYFNTIEYLKMLEKISNKIYWDNLNYVVVKYPKAKIIVKLHLLMDKTS